MKTKKTIFIISFLFSVLCGYAKGDSWKSIADTLKVPHSKVMKSLVIDSVIPYDTEKSMVVMPVEQDSSKNVYDLHILIVENPTNNIYAHYIDEAKIFVSSKKKVSAIKFDFANFKLNNTTRAFGVRVCDSMSSDVYMMKNEFMSLYVEKKGRIEKVLDNVLISSVNDQWNLQNCEGDHFSETKIVVMSRKKKKKATDYRDIIIKDRVVSVKNFIKRDSTVSDSLADIDSIHKQKISKNTAETTISYNDGEVVALGGDNKMVMHDKLIDIEKVDADSLAKMLDDEKEKKNSMSGEALDIYNLEHINQEGDCIETTTTEWMREYYVYKNGQYVQTVEPK